MTMTVPGNIPELDPSGPVREAGQALAKAAAGVEARAKTIQRGWARLEAVYHAPEEGLLLQAMNKPVTSATTLSDHTDQVKGALETYADRLDELNRQRTTLIADISAYESALRDFQSDTGLLSGVRFAREAELMDQGQDLQRRRSEWMAAVEEAQRACANAVRALFGAPALKAADHATVEETEAGLAYGMSAKAYDAQAQTNQAGWRVPFMWNGSSAWGKTRGFVQGMGDWVAGTVEFGDTLITGGDHGERDVLVSHLKQTGEDLGTLYLAGQPDGYIVDPATGTLIPSGTSGPLVSQEEAAAARERLVAQGKAAIGWDSWGTSGWRQAGAFAPDVALSVFGGAGVARGAAGGAARGVTKGALTGALTRVAPGAPTRVAQLSGAMSALRPGRVFDRVTSLDPVNNALTRAEARAYRTADRVSAGRHWVRSRVQQAAQDTATSIRSLAGGQGPQVAYAGLVGATRGEAGRGLSTPGVVYRTEGTPGAGTRSGGAGSGAGTTPGSQAGTGTGSRAGWPPRYRAPGSHPGSQPGAPVRAEFKGDLSTGMDGRPPEVKRRIEMDFTGTYERLMPKFNETFGENLIEKAESVFGAGAPEVERLRNAEVVVRGRGTFFTDGDGAVKFVEPVRRTLRPGGRPLPFVGASTDLRKPLPNATYLVDNRTFFHTNDKGWTDHVYISEFGPPQGRSASAQAAVRAPGYDAGHLQRRADGGAREEINLVKMVRGFNRGGPGRSAENGNSWRALEGILRDSHTPGDGTAVEIIVEYSDGSDGAWVAGRSLSNRDRLAPSPSRLIVRALDAQGNRANRWRMYNE